jgi:hypothetical protein
MSAQALSACPIVQTVSPMIKYIVDLGASSLKLTFLLIREGIVCAFSAALSDPPKAFGVDKMDTECIRTPAHEFAIRQLSSLGVSTMNMTG